MMIKLLKVLQREMNFSYSLVEPEGTTFGSKLKNGSWNGLFGSLQRKEVDLTIMDLTILLERTEVLTS